jgi:hypothetical protein
MIKKHRIPSIYLYYHHSNNATGEVHMTGFPEKNIYYMLLHDISNRIAALLNNFLGLRKRVWFTVCNVLSDLNFLVCHFLVGPQKFHFIQTLQG